MRLRNLLVLMLVSVICVVTISYLGGEVLMGQVTPFSRVQDISSTDAVSTVSLEGTSVQFLDGDLEIGWIPWIIRQVSILTGALSFVVFVYAGVRLILYGDNEEELANSSKMMVYAVIGIALAAFSYAIIANILALFPAS